LNKKGFAAYYVLFFIIVIFLIAYVYSSRVMNSTVNLVRDFEKLKAKELCDLGKAFALNVIYKNYSQGSYDFYKSLSFPIKLKTETGNISIESIDVVKEFFKGKQKVLGDFKNVPLIEQGKNTGKYDVLEVKITGKTKKSQEVKGSFLFKVKRLEIVE